MRDELTSDGYCFACGALNPCGLHLEFEETPEGYRTELQTRREHTGYAGIVHGGLITTVLDELAARYTWVKGRPCVTAKLQVRLKKPLIVGEKLVAYARLVSERRNFSQAHCVAYNGAGDLIAEAEVTLARMKPKE